MTTRRHCRRTLELVVVEVVCKCTGQQKHTSKRQRQQHTEEQQHMEAQNRRRMEQEQNMQVVVEA